MSAVFELFFYPSEGFSQWVKINSINNGHYPVCITRDSSGYILLATNIPGEIYRSSDNGYSWIPYRNGFPQYQIKCMFSIGDMIFVGTYGNSIYISSNHGLNWTQRNNGIPSYACVNCITKNSNCIFAGLQTGVYKSTDMGLNWQQCNSGLTIPFAWAITAKDSILVTECSMGSSGYMYRSFNSGANWSLINNGLPLFCMDYVNFCRDDLYALNMTDGLYKSTNYGDQWLNLSFGGCLLFSTMSSRGDTVIISLLSPTKEFITTTNAGLSWQRWQSDLPGLFLNNIIFLPDCIIGTSTQGEIFRSTNLGLNWSNSMLGFKELNIQNISIKYSHIIASTKGSGVYRSVNLGYNWNKYTELEDNGIFRFIWRNNDIFTNNNSSLMYDSYFGGVFSQYGTPLQYRINSFTVLGNCFLVYAHPVVMKSVDAGVTWVSSGNGLPDFVSASNIFSNDSICFIGIKDLFSNYKLFISTNFGTNWDSLSGSAMVGDPNCISFNQKDGKYYAGTGKGVYTSSNTGLNWVYSDSGLPDSIYVTSFFFNGDTVYFSSLNYGIYRKAYNDMSWETYNDGLEDLNINILCPGPYYLFAGSAYGGIFQRGVNIISVQNISEICKEYTLFQNYPNPFNTSTNIKYQILKNSFVTLRVFDILGKEVATLVNEKQNAGTYKVTFNGNELSSGVYFYKLEAGKFSQTKKMVLLK